MNRTKPTEQRYEAYTTEDFEVWKMLYQRQMDTLQTHASSLYLDAAMKTGFNEHEIPEFKRLNLQLGMHTGWRVHVVPEIVPIGDFFRSLSRKNFPATCWLRSRAELDYIEEPDMFHDVFGHVPLLANEHYADFISGFGKLGVKWQNNEMAMEMLGRVYWYTIEFGMLYENGGEKIFGSGIISSIEETRHSVSPGCRKSVFDIKEMLHTPYRTDILQEQYFVIDSFEQLCRALPEIDGYLRDSCQVETAENSHVNI